MKRRAEKGPKLEGTETAQMKFVRLWTQHGPGSAKSWARAHYPGVAQLWIEAMRANGRMMPQALDTGISQELPAPEPEATTPMLAYGMNMPTGSTPVGSNPRPARLDDWRLEFRGFANITPRRGSHVAGVVYDCTAEQLATLDYVEGVRHEAPKYGMYRRAWVEVQTTRGTERCVAYVMTQFMRTRAVGTPPVPSYVAMLLRGYREFGLDAGPMVAALQPFPGIIEVKK